MESTFNRPELTIEKLEDPGSGIERCTGSNKEGFRFSTFLIWETWIWKPFDLGKIGLVVHSPTIFWIYQVFIPVFDSQDFINNLDKNIIFSPINEDLLMFDNC